jgi:ribosomal protein S18 acetylase RimI-like enzyme
MRDGFFGEIENAILNLMKISITKVTPEDAEAVRQIHYETWLQTYPNEELGITPEDIEELFVDRFTEEFLAKQRKKFAGLSDNQTFVIAKEGGKAVGFCHIVHSEGEGRVRAFYVLPSAQRKGVGKQLWESVKSELDLTHPTYVNLADYNEGARMFYEKLGFEDTGKRFSNPEHSMGNGTIIPEMEMVLEGE